jgi:hypothetical protein
VDAASVVAHLQGRAPGAFVEMAIACGVLAAGGFVLQRLGASRPAPADSLAASLVCLLVVSSVYHLGYDLVLLALPLTALASDRCAAAWALTPRLRWTLAALLTLPWVNYLTSGAAIDRLGLSGSVWTAVTALNGVALLAALVLLLAHALRRSA